MDKKRSVGVMVFGILIIAISIFILIKNPKLFTTKIFSIISLISGIGIIVRNNWARVLFLCQITIYLLFGIAGSYGLLIATGDLIRIILSYFFPKFFLPFLVSVYYLTRPNVKEQFK